MSTPQLVMRRPNLDGLPEMPTLPTGYTLREFQPDDLTGLAAVLSKAFEDPGWTPDRVRKDLTETPDVKKTFVVTYEGVPVATASAQLRPKYPDSGAVHWVAADPAHRGKGLGYAVTLAVLYEFVRLGLKDAVLVTDDFRLAAIKTYQSLGFSPEHEHETHPERWAIVAANLLASFNL